METLLSLPSDVLLEALPGISSQTPGLTPTQTVAIITKLWVSLLQLHLKGLFCNNTYIFINASKCKHKPFYPVFKGDDECPLAL